MLSCLVKLKDVIHGNFAFLIPVGEQNYYEFNFTSIKNNIRTPKQLFLYTFQLQLSCKTRKLKQPNYDRNMNKQELSVTQIIILGDTCT